MGKHMNAFFADYQWSQNKPQGLAPIDDPIGKKHFLLMDVEGGVRVEEFDEHGKFTRLAYCPQDDIFTGTTYKNSTDHRHRIRRAPDGSVRFYEQYEWPDGVYSENAYPKVKVFNEHGRLTAEHHPQRVSETAWDIHVFDALGKLRVVLHHTNVGQTEPCTIREEYA
jgi:hypothetical protein